ncbi:hypothetical protein [Rhodoferax antarcticus]|uniref:DUF1887 family protein n=1 Tax=Rhodoferax antarcticus ANT.BR TaxID=1111071 RepID=A0A1Q8YDP7_9BURK|nr:hypothetical protein [Rhodoferax antarcticus]APW46035.1 hypothetical protein RA876_06195 [Rhodoferax antarcticus]OLP06174.1 hypothetical protein BLL52_2405 [Rhodoferax antarcticus ANT.BR]
MPIYRCNKCGFIAETVPMLPGSKIPCTRCTHPSTVYETVFFAEKLAERYFAALREIEALKVGDKSAALSDPATPGAATATSSAVKPAPAPPAIALDQLDLHNTASLATPEQHQPLKQWFKTRQIEAQFDYNNVDTTGFFDDAARALGDNFALFAELLERIRYAYRNSHSGLNLELANVSQKDAQALTTLCRQFYSHTLFARYNYQKPEKIVHLTLQTATTVRQFFEGGWLEWLVLVELLEQLKAKKCAFSCARGVKVVFPNEDLHEIDVMALVETQSGQTPIYIECKTGEFRREIDKFLRLKKRLGIPRQQFIICASDLSDEQAAGLCAMYELTFVNLQTLAAKLQALI